MIRRETGGAVRVSGPVTGGVRGRPFGPGCVGGLDYIVEEFFLEGEARAYRPVDETWYDPSGPWNVEVNRSAPYRTRILVVRPQESKHFNGTVLVNWQNVTRGLETGAPPVDLALLGLAWVGVSAQCVGHTGFPGAEHVALKGWDPDRYAPLEHPGDDFSFDLFTQAAMAIGPDGWTHADDPDPMGGLDVTTMIATGSSQSALRLRSYVNAIQPVVGLFDGFFLTLDVGRGAELHPCDVAPATPLSIPSVPVRIRTDLSVPVLVVNSESEVLRYHGVRQPDTHHFALWEIAGSAHISGSAAEVAEMDRHLQDFGIDPTSGMVPRRDDANVVSHAPVVRAALPHMLRWLDGVPPPPQSHIEVEPGDLPAIRRDQHGNALGGVRLPELEVPLAQHCGLHPDADNILDRISGSSVTFPEGKLKTMYDGRSAYLEQYAHALDTAIAAGVLVDAERRAMIVAAESFSARVLTW